jgi:hypothetical protein
VNFGDFARDLAGDLGEIFLQLFVEGLKRL